MLSSKTFIYLFFIERTIRNALKKFGQRPGVRRTFRFSSHTQLNTNNIKLIHYSIFDLITATSQNY